MEISVIIPAYNEQEFIARTVGSIRKHMPAGLAHEIFVVDHGSKDDTRRIAQEAGAIVIDGREAKTISNLRNRGIAAASGRYLLFLDADTTLTEGWTTRIRHALQRLDANPRLILGSKRSIPDDASWVSRAWFVNAAEGEHEPGHLGGGHILANRDFVREIGGFPEYMETGEDFEFCVIARRHGARIVSDPQLKAVHNGVPQLIREFFNREKWHGRGDFASLSIFLSSKVALLAMGFFVAHLALLIALGLGWGLAALLALAAIAALCAGCAWLKLRARSPARLIQGSALFYLYYWARTLAGIQVALSPEAKKVNRASR
jgi:glycosyltransferase involved in cell wall biosynthesis